MNNLCLHGKSGRNVSKGSLSDYSEMYGAIQLKKHGKIIEVYDVKRHYWSKRLAGLIIKECKNANLKDWELPISEIVLLKN